MLNIYVDGDSCPVKEEILKVADRHQLEVFIVSNKWLLHTIGPRVHRILVEAGPDVADNWIVEHIEVNDIIITNDILLADRCIKKQSSVIAPSGKVFTTSSIGMAVAMRDLKAHLRETGEMSYNPSFSKQNRSNFLQSLEEEIQKIKRIM